MSRAKDGPAFSRPERVAANSSSRGAAVPAIMPTIIVTHIANVRRTSAAVQGIVIVIPISAILFSYCIDEDIWRSRWSRYAQASAVMITIQVEMRTRSRRGRAAAADDRLRTPGKRRVLAGVLAAEIVPPPTEWLGRAAL